MEKDGVREVEDALWVLHISGLQGSASAGSSLRASLLSSVGLTSEVFLACECWSTVITHIAQPAPHVTHVKDDQIRS